MNPQSKSSPALSRWKRVLDVIVSGGALACLWPLLGAAAVAIRINMGGPVIFRQTRPGYMAQQFTAVKFRTMRDSVGPDGRPLSDGERITRLGEILRKTSLDELPQLWNVLKGDMSLVGPRPLLFEFIDAYTPHHARRHETKPGITGWAQINGRNSIPYSRRFDLDVWYIDNWSIWLDLKILIRTPMSVFSMSDSDPVENRALLDDLGLLPENRNKTTVVHASDEKAG